MRELLARVTPWLPSGHDLARGLPMGAAAGVFAYLFGGWDNLIGSLVVAVALDLVTGFSAAYIDHRLASEDFLRGVIKKTLYFAAVALAVIADRVLPSVTVADIEVSVRSLLIMALLGGEMLSVAENLALSGVPLPSWFVTRLRRVADQSQAVDAGVPDGTSR